MNAVKTRTTAPAITVCNGLATVLTTNISAVFEKNHRHVLRDVEDIIQRTPEDRRGNFIPVELEAPFQPRKGHRQVQSVCPHESRLHVPRHGLYRREG